MKRRKRSGRRATTTRCCGGMPAPGSSWETNWSHGRRTEWSYSWNRPDREHFAVRRVRPTPPLQRRQDFLGVFLRLHLGPNLLDLAVRPDEERHAVDAHVFLPQK